MTKSLASSTKVFVCVDARQGSDAANVRKVLRGLRTSKKIKFSEEDVDFLTLFHLELVKMDIADLFLAVSDFHTHYRFSDGVTTETIRHVIGVH